MERKTTLVSGRSLRIRRGSLEAAHAGHADIHEDHVGPHLLRQRDGIQRVGGFSDHFHVGFGGEQGPDALPEECVIVG